MMTKLAATGSPAGSPTANPITVAISSSFLINGQSVAISSQDIDNIKKGINFQLAQPVALGSINDFLNWLNETFGVPLTAKELGDMIDKLPNEPLVVKNIKDALKGILSAVITITVLSVNTATGEYRFGVTMTPLEPINILNVLSLETIGVEIGSAETPAGSPAG